MAKAFAARFLPFEDQSSLDAVERHGPLGHYFGSIRVTR